MDHAEPPAPRQFLGVMISSTFKDLKQHRAALIASVSGQGLHPISMEYDSAKPGATVIDSSLNKVRECAAYVGIIGVRYGNIPDSEKCNPEHLSITELEFREARRLGRPILLFIMGPDHDVKPRDVETDPEKKRKLDAFREDAKLAAVSSQVHRIYKVFNSLNEFEVSATQAIAELRELIDRQFDAARHAAPATELQQTLADGIPAPPTLYAEPRYIGSHTFVGRAEQMAALNEWASSADAHACLLFEAIGGTGKSMLTWEWATNHARNARKDWAGVFWYSFYEKGAFMVDFCRRALAYMTGRPTKTFESVQQPELAKELIRQLQARSWLLILDGLERVLVAYHRYDAAQVPDELAGTADEIAQRDPCKAIRPLDEDLIWKLAAASPSKILITSRLVPSVLLNAAGRPLPGVVHKRLPGLRPADAEALLRACGVHGSPRKMQDYMQRHCDCHPLVTGVVAGLINDYLPDRGHFDAWAADPEHGGHLDLADLNLIQKRNHILTTALEALSDAGRRLLSTLSLLAESFDYTMLAALNPHRPAAEEHEAKVALNSTVRDLEQRGLLQYDRQAARWDMHPVVRSVAFSTLGDQDRTRVGQRIIDHFSRQHHDPYQLTKSIEDLRDVITVVRTYFQIGREDEAWTMLKGDLMNALLFNVEAYPECLALLQPFFPYGWSAPTIGAGKDDLGSLASNAAISFSGLGEFAQSVELDKIVVQNGVSNRKWHDTRVGLTNLSADLLSMNRLADSHHYAILALRVARVLNISQDLFRARLNSFEVLAAIGHWDEAEKAWNQLSRMGREWPRNLYRPGSAEQSFLEFFQFPLGRLTDEDITGALAQARNGNNRQAMRRLYRLQGKWRLARYEYALAAESLQDAIRMAHEANFPDLESETMLALARFHLGQLPAPREEAARLSARDPSHLSLAELWLAIEDNERAIIHAEAAYRHAWADGEPYVRRDHLDRAKTLLQRLGEDTPSLPAYDRNQHVMEPWEFEILTEIKKLRKVRRSDPRNQNHI
jgi:Domain of unknown function (DUF4062)